MTTKLSIILATLILYPSLVFAITDDQRKMCKAISECRKHYQEYGCEDLKSNPELAKSVTNCGPQDVNASYFKGSGRTCAKAVGNAGKQMLTGLANLPSTVINNSDKHFNQNKMAYEMCYAELGYNNFEAEDVRLKLIEEHMDRGETLKREDDPRVKINRCFQKKVAEIRNYKFPNIPGWDDAVKLYKGVSQGLRCLNAAGISQYACPMIAGALGGGVTGIAGKKLLAKIAKRKNMSGRNQRDMDDLDNNADKEKEKLSIAHQEDVLDGLDSPAAREAARRAGVDHDQMVAGILDSDAGKLDHFWKQNFLTPSKTNDDLIRSLQGKSDTPHGRILKQIFDEHYEGRPMLPSSYSVKDIRRVIDPDSNGKSGLIGYHHEMPGLAHAIRDFKKGLINETQFRTRVEANLGHNGPHAGFWEKFGNDFATGRFTSQDADFYKGTMYDGGRRNDQGVLTPNYPAPKTTEGFIHMGLDRMSQGSRGGMRKIFYELGGDTLNNNPSIKLGKIKGFNGKPGGLNNLVEMITVNPVNTQKQLQAMVDSLADANVSPAISGKQRRALQSYAKTLDNRMKLQNKFIKSNVTTYPKSGGPPYTKLVLNYTDAAGNKITKTITSNTPADEALDAMDKMMLAEERLNGDPLKGLGKPNKPGVGKSPLITAGTGANAIPKYCDGLLDSGDGQAPEHRPAASQ